MKPARLALLTLALTAALHAQVAAQRNDAAAQPFDKPAELRLTLILSPRVPNRPGDVNLIVRFVNSGNRKLMMPKLYGTCGSDDGSIEITKKLLSAARRPESNGVWVADFFGPRNVLAEAEKHWVTLAPGAAYDVPAELRFDNPGGRYELRAKYSPAQLTPKELSLLSEHGINAVQESPESEPLVIKSPK